MEASGEANVSAGAIEFAAVGSGRRGPAASPNLRVGAPAERVEARPVGEPSALTTHTS